MDPLGMFIRVGILFLLKQTYYYIRSKSKSPDSQLKQDNKEVIEKSIKKEENASFLA